MATPDTDLVVEPAKFQLLSDLHFEGNTIENEYLTYLKKVKVTAPNLILAGDIGVPSTASHEKFYISFLQQCCQRYQRVFLLAGNTEYQTRHTCSQLDQMMQAWARDPALGGETSEADLQSWEPNQGASGKLYVLQRNTPLYLQGHSIVILGCTLWSNIRHGQSLTDGRGLGGGMNSVLAHNERHRQDLGWIKEQVKAIRTSGAYDETTKILVITHHAPTIFKSNQPNRDGKGPSWSNFQTDILGGEGVEGLREGDVWVYGHTHFSNDFKQDGVRVIANQRGGARNDVKIAQTHFNPDFMFEM